MGLIDALDARLKVLDEPPPYFDSGHVPNVAYNALCGGDVLEDVEVRCNEGVFLDALGARSIPSTTNERLLPPAQGRRAAPDRHRQRGTAEGVAHAESGDCS